MGDLDVHVLMGNFDGRSVFTWRSFAIANIDTTGGRERRTGPIYAYGAGIEERTITSVLNPFNLLIWLLVLGCSVAVAICLVLAMLLVACLLRQIVTEEESRLEEKVEEN